MLLSLHLRDFVIVDELELNFSQGFTVLTGETGAGKSILIDALGLLLGDRADAGVVRHGADKAELSATFDICRHAMLAERLKADALDGDDGFLLVRRTIDAAGRSRAFVNGQAATLTQLRDIGEYLVAIHGQHAHQSLMRSDAQRDLLDAYAGQTSLAREVKQRFSVWKQTSEKLAEAKRHAGEFAAERERLQWQIDEVRALNLASGEWAELQAEQSRLSHAVSLIDGGQAALNTLAEADVNAQDMLATVQTRLQDLAALDPALNEAVELLAAVDANLSEAVHALRRYADKVELDPSRLAELERRMDDVFRLSRKYRIEPEQLADKLAGWQARLNELGGAEGIDALEQANLAAEAAYQQVATKLSQTRQEFAASLGDKVSEQMQDLAMAGSRFDIALFALETPAAFGLEQVEFQVAQHAGVPARALAKVASGGELSRISLALQVVTSQVAAVPTLIFDEVDVGIGGRVAEMVGKLLKTLGTAHQVLCVTHLPQVAASGDQQFQVSKQQQAGAVVSQIQQLTPAARVEEIARMLGGMEITDTTRRHAAELLGQG